MQNLIGLAQFKAIILIASIVSVLSYLWWSPDYYREQGRREKIKQYEAAVKSAIDSRQVAIDKLVLQHKIDKLTVEQFYEDKLKIQAEKHAAEIRRSDSFGGMRIPKSSCGPTKGVTETSSSGIDNEKESIQLPEGVTRDLREFAKKADRLNVQLEACQNWIVTSGFYKYESTDKE